MYFVITVLRYFVVFFLCDIFTMRLDAAGELLEINLQFVGPAVLFIFEWNFHSIRLAMYVR